MAEENLDENKVEVSAEETPKRRRMTRTRKAAKAGDDAPAEPAPAATALAPKAEVPAATAPVPQSPEPKVAPAAPAVADVATTPAAPVASPNPAPNGPMQPTQNPQGMNRRQWKNFQRNQRWQKMRNGGFQGPNGR